MPAVGDYLLTTIGRLWSLLEADTGDGSFDDLVRTGNRIKYHTEIPDPERDGATGHGHTPECKIYIEGSLGFSFVRSGGTMPNFGMYSRDPCAFATEDIVAFAIEYTFANLDYHLGTRAKCLTERILSKSGGKLATAVGTDGLSYVKGWGPIRTEWTKTSTAQGDRRRKRLRVKIVVPIAFMLQKGDILG